MRCANGAVNRESAWSGDPDVYDYGNVTAVDGECVAHTGCDAGERCAVDDWCLSQYARCVEVCTGDADCAADEACVPPEVHGQWIAWPTCVSASCWSAADCGSGQCGFWETGEVPTMGQSCRTDADECAGPCEEVHPDGDRDVYECRPDRGRWTCLDPTYDCD